MNTVVSYSPIPALHNLIAVPDNECGDKSRLQLLSEGLLRAQMNLSRVIIYGEESGNANVPMVRDAMNLIADIYDEFCTIEKSRKDYEQYILEASSKV